MAYFKTIDSKIEVYRKDVLQSTIQWMYIMSIVANSTMNAVGHCTISLDNTNGRHKTTFQVGDKLKIYIQKSGGTLDHLYTALVTSPAVAHSSGSGETMVVDCRDYILSLAERRTTYNVWQHTAASTIITEILNEKLTEAGQTHIDEDLTEISIRFEGVTVAAALLEIAKIRGYQISGDKDANIYYNDYESRDSEVTVDYDKVDNISHQKSDTGLANVLRYYGGKKSTRFFQTNTSRTTTYLVTDTDTKTTLLTLDETRPVARVHIWTKSGTYDDDLVVALQGDDGGSPDGVDIVTKRISGPDLSDDGWTTFEIPGYNTDVLTQHIVVRASDTNGVDIGVDGEGDLSYYAGFVYPIIGLVEDMDSIDTYGRYDGQPVRDLKIQEREIIMALASSELAKRKYPEESLSYDCRIELAIDTGETCTVNFADEGISGGTYTLFMKSIRYYGTTLTEVHTLQYKDRVKDIAEKLAEYFARTLELEMEESYYEEAVVDKLFNVYETVTVSDSVDIQIGGDPKVEDAVGVADSVSVQEEGDPKIEDAVGIGDSVVSITEQAKGTFVYGTAKYVFFDYAPDLLSVNTKSATDITASTATLNGVITAIVGGGSSADAIGFEWGLDSNYGSDWTNSATYEIGVISHEISGLSASTSCHFKAKAHDDNGWESGEDISFVTS